MQLLRFLLLCSSIALVLANTAHAKREWLIAADDEFQFYSNATKARTQSLYEELHDAREIFHMLFPKLKGLQGRQLRIVLCHDSKTMRELTPLFAGKPKDVGGVFFHDAEGAFMLVGNYGEQTRNVLLHEYIHYLTHGKGQYVPPWLSEGLAELFSTVSQDDKGKVKVGEPIESRVLRLREDGPMDFERFFKVTLGSPEYNSSDHGRHVFYAQAWALLHYFLFGHHDLGDDAFQRLLSMGIQTPVIDAESFKAAFGIDFGELQKRIRRYTRDGKYRVPTYTLPAEKRPAEIALRVASKAERNLIYGFVLLRSRGDTAAYPHLARALTEDPSLPDVQAFNGHLFFQRKNYEVALPYFQRAIELGSDSAWTHLYHARSLARKANPNARLEPGALDPAETTQVLTSLFKARERAGPFTPQLYHLIGEAFVSTRLEVTDKNIAVLFEGLKAYPDEERIAFYLAMYLDRTKRFDDALAVIDRYLARDLPGNSIKNLQTLRERVERNKARAASR